MNEEVLELDEVEDVPFQPSLCTTDSDIDWDDDDDSLRHSIKLGKKNSEKWATTNGIFFPCPPTKDNLPSGKYEIIHDYNIGIVFRPKSTILDKLMILPDSVSEEIINEIEYFWTRREVFKNLGFLWKRGVLMYGPPGSGKTSTLEILTRRVVEHGGLAIYAKEPKLVAQGLQILRHIEPNRPIIVMLEDIDAIQREHGESDLLALLDGDLQINNVVFLATTNYPENLDQRLINRPSRFDLIRKIGMPNREARNLFLASRNPNLKANERKMWVEATEGFSIAHLKELIISVEALGQNFNMSVERLRVMISQELSSDDDDDDDYDYCGEGPVGSNR